MQTDRRQQSYNTAQETATETEADIFSAIAKQKDKLTAVKKKGSDAGKHSAMCKRIWVAWFALAFYVLPSFMGTFFVFISMQTAGICIFSEAINIYDKQSKRAIQESTHAINWLIYFTIQVVVIPQLILRPYILQNSGFLQEDYPGLHAFCSGLNLQLALAMMILTLVIFVINLRKNSLKYQFTHFTSAMLWGLQIAFAVDSVVFMQFCGIWWGVFCPLITAANDMFAYFVGRTFGRTSLITLSPNKTLEGFVGGAVCTFIIILFVFD